jgi:hypothetical protein
MFDYPESAYRRTISPLAITAGPATPATRGTSLRTAQLTCRAEAERNRS